MLRTNDIITAEHLANIIAKHGTGYLMIDGGEPEFYEDAEDLELQDQDRFSVQINYGQPVRFLLVTVDEDGRDTVDGVFRAEVTTGLRGEVRGFEWVAKD